MWIYARRILEEIEILYDYSSFKNHIHGLFKD